MSLLAELKRRNVVRVAIAYVVLSWVLLQIGDVLFEVLGVPDWGMKLLFGLLLLGFPVAMIFAWVFELTPDGLRRDDGVGTDPAYSARTARKLNIAVIVLLLVAIGASVGGRWLPAHETVPATEQPPQAEAPTPATFEETRRASIAVLPFEALSEDASDTFFGKGIAEELLNTLAGFPELKVAARTSAFSFEGRGMDIRAIGQELGVDHVLEGSVRRAGDRLRITAQLIRADDGSHLWSETYDRTMTDIFAIQDEIVAALARQLQVRLGVGGGAGRAERGDVDPQAYEQYLQGLAFWGDRDKPSTNRQAAISAFRVATQIAPTFADAWAALGNAYVFSTAGNFDMDPLELLEMTEGALTQALTLDPDNAAAHAGMLVFRATYTLDFEAAERHLEQAVALAPSRAETHYAVGRYAETVGDIDRAQVAFDRAIALDPLNQTVQRMRSVFMITVGRTDEGIAFYDRCARSDCSDSMSFFGLAAMAVAGDRDRARQWLEVEQTINELFELPEEQRPPFYAVLRMLADRATLGAADSSQALTIMPPDEMGLPGLFGPIYANGIPVDESGVPDEALAQKLLGMLEWAADNAILMTEPFSPSPFISSDWTYPDWLLEHPGYHALWEKPGMPELAAKLRANGHEHGLPKAPSTEPE